MKVTFHLKQTNKYGGASYKAVNSRATGTLYCSPKTFSGEPPATLEIESDGLADPSQIAASTGTSDEAKAEKLRLKQEAKAAKDAARAAAKAEKAKTRDEQKAQLNAEREAKKAAKAAERAAMAAAGKATAVPADAPQV